MVGITTGFALTLVQTVLIQVPAVRLALGIKPQPSASRTRLHELTVSARERGWWQTLLRPPPPSVPADPQKHGGRGA